MPPTATDGEMAGHSQSPDGSTPQGDIACPGPWGCGDKELSAGSLSHSLEPRKARFAQQTCPQRECFGSYRPSPVTFPSLLCSRGIVAGSARQRCVAETSPPRPAHPWTANGGVLSFKMKGPQRGSVSRQTSRAPADVRWRGGQIAERTDQEVEWVWRSLPRPSICAAQQEKRQK